MSRLWLIFPYFFIVGLLFHGEWTHKQTYKQTCGNWKFKLQIITYKSNANLFRTSGQRSWRRIWRSTVVFSRINQSPVRRFPLVRPEVVRSDIGLYRFAIELWFKGIPILIELKFGDTLVRSLSIILTTLYWDIQEKEERKLKIEKKAGKRRENPINFLFFLL